MRDFADQHRDGQADRTIETRTIRMPKVAPVIMGVLIALAGLSVESSHSKGIAPTSRQRLLSDNAPAPNQPRLSIFSLGSPAGNESILMDIHEFTPKFVTKRPDKGDTKIRLCVAAAPGESGIGGLYVVDGKAPADTKPDNTLSGAVIIDKEGYHIIDTGNGAKLDAAFLKGLEEQKGALFQQVLLVKGKKAQAFTDVKKMHRRALVDSSSGTKAIVESEEPLTVGQWAKDLADLQADNAVSLEAGALDEGWYRNNKGEVIPMGKEKTATAKQSSWFILTTGE